MNSENCEDVLKEIRDEMKEVNGSLKEMKKVQEGIKEGVGKIQAKVDSSDYYNFLTSDTLQRMMRGFQTGWGAAPHIEICQAAMNKIVPGIPSFPDVSTASSSSDNNTPNESSAPEQISERTRTQEDNQDGPPAEVDKTSGFIESPH